MFNCQLTTSNSVVSVELQNYYYRNKVISNKILNYILCCRVTTERNIIYNITTLFWFKFGNASWRGQKVESVFTTLTFIMCFFVHLNYSTSLSITVTYGTTRVSLIAPHHFVLRVIISIIQNDKTTKTLKMKMKTCLENHR